MERKLKTFDVVFDFGNNEIYTEIDAESLQDAYRKIKEVLSESWSIADFQSILINPKLLQAVEVRELSQPKEQDDTI